MNARPRATGFSLRRWGLLVTLIVGAIAGVAAAAVVSIDVRSALMLDARPHGFVKPHDGQIVQRGGPLEVEGHIGLQAFAAELALMPEGASGLVTADWHVVPERPRLGTYHTALHPAPGWYWLFARAWGQTRIAVDPPIRVGVGELFVVAGQSNAAGSSGELHMPATPWMRSARLSGDQLAWGNGADPQVLGAAGSVWPIVGDRLGTRLHLPIGVINVAEGGTGIHEWQPGKLHFQRLVAALKAAGPGHVRAVLWQQGENDLGMAENDYTQLLTTLIRSVRAEVDVPWLIALSSPGDVPGDAPLRAAQLRVCHEGLALPGPDLHDLNAGYRELDMIHLNAAGTQVAATRWTEAIERAFFNR